jgi:hypothetical protein
MTDKKIKPEIPLEAQLQEQLKKIQFTFHKSARNYFDREVNYRFNRAGQFDDRN